MFQIHLGKTPHNLQAVDFERLGKQTEGMSGSDISVVVREALMEPLRKCRSAQYFRAVPGPAGERKWEPVANSDAQAVFRNPATARDPPCSYCPPFLKSEGRVPASGASAVLCNRCGCARIDLMSLNTAELSVPDVCMEDFVAVLPRARATVGASELEKYVQWTANFGQEGS
jgi:vacuolar protein-sorting-associated protein 4